jgi:hypothetical protein
VFSQSPWNPEVWLHKKATRQASSREFPPQSEKTSLVSKLVETWEKIPDHIKKEEKESVAKKKIK